MIVVIFLLEILLICASIMAESHSLTQGKIVKAIDSVNLLNVGTLAAVTFLYYCAL